MKVRQLLEGDYSQSSTTKVSAPNLGPSSSWKELPQFAKAASEKSQSLKKEVDDAKTAEEKFKAAAKYLKVTGDNSVQVRAYGYNYAQDNQAGGVRRIFITSYNKNTGEVEGHLRDKTMVSFNTADLEFDKAYKLYSSATRQLVFDIHRNKVKTLDRKLEEPKKKEEPKYDLSSWGRKSD